MAVLSKNVTNLIEQTITGLGYEFVGAEMVSQRNSKLLRIYIDGTDGVVIDDCVIVSNQLSGVLDVEEPIKGQYQLEVSSPGVERPLFRLEDYQRFQGHQALLELYEAVDGRRNIRGVLEGIQENSVLINTVSDNQQIELPFSSIRKARLIAEYELSRKKGS
ncbi:MAG: ribosome maturation factor RimP [Methylococcales bacterium]